MEWVTAVVLLGFLGSTAGVVFRRALPWPLSGRRRARAARPQPHSTSDLVIMTRDDYPGVLVIAHGRSITFSVKAASVPRTGPSLWPNRAVIAVNNGKVKARLYGTLSPAGGRYTLMGLLGVLSAALGFLIPPRSHVTAAA